MLKHATPLPRIVRAIALLIIQFSKWTPVLTKPTASKLSLKRTKDLVMPSKKLQRNKPTWHQLWPSQRDSPPRPKLPAWNSSRGTALSGVSVRPNSSQSCSQSMSYSRVGTFVASPQKTQPLTSPLFQSRLNPFVPPYASK